MSQIAVANPQTIDVLGAPMTIFAEGGSEFPYLADHPVPPGYGVPLHVHESEDEAFYILEGEVTLLDGHSETRAKPGMLVSLPRGVAHGYRNDTPHLARVLVMCGPRAAEMFRHFDRTKPGPEQLPAICDQYAVAFVPPEAT